MRAVAVGWAMLLALACGSGTSRTSDRLAAADAERERARAEAVARNEAARLAALWNYADVPVGRRRQISASIRSANDVATGAAEAQAVLLVFRDHPQWGRSSYLVLESGEFNCPRCSVDVTADEGTPVELPAHRARSDEAIALFIDDAKALWRMADAGTRVTIEFPIRGIGTRRATFDVGGLDPSKMPGWP